MNSGISGSASAVGIALCLGLAFTPLGCGSNQDHAVEPWGRRAHEGPSAPESTVAQLRECAERGALRLTDTHYAILFDVNAMESGHVSLAKVRDSMIPDRGMESCMGRALEAMVLPRTITALRPSQRVSSGMVSPESRAHTGNALVIGAAVELLPILIVAAGVTIIVAVTVHVMSDKSASTRDATDEERERERCKKVKQDCITYCSDTTLPTPNFGWEFQKCKNECLERQDCPRDS
jgi:hypothetical protein